MPRWRALPVALALCAWFASACGKPNRTRDAAIATGAAVAAAGVYRATSGGCWAQCGPGLICDRKSGTCVESVAQSSPTPATAPSAANVSEWWSAGDAACPEGSQLDQTPSPEGDRVVSCVRPDGTLHGRATFFHGNGRREMEGEYRDGKPVGTWTHWDPDGQQTKTENLGP